MRNKNKYETYFHPKHKYKQRELEKNLFITTNIKKNKHKYKYFGNVEI